MKSLDVIQSQQDGCLQFDAGQLFSLVKFFGRYLKIVQTDFVKLFFAVTYGLVAFRADAVQNFAYRLVQVF